MKKSLIISIPRDSWPVTYHRKGMIFWSCLMIGSLGGRWYVTLSREHRGKKKSIPYWWNSGTNITIPFQSLLLLYTPTARPQAQATSQARRAYLPWQLVPEEFVVWLSCCIQIPTHIREATVRPYYAQCYAWKFLGRHYDKLHLIFGGRGQ